MISLSSCDWISLAYNAATYPTTSAGETANVAVFEGKAYLSQAEQGINILDIASKQELSRLQSAPGSESVDDLAIADKLLFTLDAREPGYLSVYSLATPSQPTLVSGPVPVAVGPFSGVSAANGYVIVSGGTKDLRLFSYDAVGNLTLQAAGIDLGRGQPDVLLAPDGHNAFVSTHEWGPYFGLTILGIDGGGVTVSKEATLELEGAGFTPGGAKPANFPIAMASEGSLLLVSYSRGLALIDVRETKLPRLIAIVPLPVEGVNVAVSGQIAAVVGSKPEPQLILIDLSDPESPEVMRIFLLEPGSYATGVAINGLDIVVADHTSRGIIFHNVVGS